MYDLEIKGIESNLSPGILESIEYLNDFWESVQKFRKKNNLDEEGIEPEEWLQNGRDDSPGREVNL